MRLLLALLTLSLLPSSLLAKDKPWTAMTIWSDGVLTINEGVKDEKVCREALCMTKNKMTCEEKEAADKKQEEAERVAKIARQKRIAEWRITHPCVEKKEEVLNYDSVLGKLKEQKQSRWHCSLPLPSGGEEIYDLTGYLLSVTSRVPDGGMSLVGSHSRTIAKQVCFQ